MNKLFKFPLNSFILAVFLGAIVQAGQVAYYSLEDDLSLSSTILNSASGGWGNATAMNDVTSGVEGIAGNAFSFANTGLADTGSKLSATGDWTVMGWVRLNPAFSNSILFGQYNNGAAGQIIINSSRSDSGVARLGIWLTGASGTESIIVAGTTVIDDGQWHFLAFTRSSDTFTVYVDGVAENSGTLAGVSLYQGVNLCLGNLSANQMTGVPVNFIDEAEVWDEALSATSIQAIYDGYFLVTFTESYGGTEILEGEYADSYSIRLANQPTDDVVITATASAADMDLGAGAGVPVSLIFTPTNYSIPQEIVVSVVDDSTDKGLRNEAISHSVVSSDLNYDGINLRAIGVQIHDNDSAEVVFYDVNDLSVSEVGATSDTYSVFLRVAPSSDVTISLAVNDEITVYPSQLTFTPSNWNIPQIVTVVAVEDDEVEEKVHVGLITHTVSSRDTSYNGIISDIAVDVNDANCGSWGYYPGDINHDCHVNMADLAVFAASWLECSDPSDDYCAEAK